MNDRFPGVFIAPTATVMGNVSIAAGSSVWFGAVLRSDMARIELGRNTSVQDNAVMHVRDGVTMRIGNNVTVGHSAVVHAACVEDTVLIGIGAIVLDGATVGKGSIVGAGALITEGKQIPKRSLVLGVPGRVVKEVTAEQVQWIEDNAKNYAELARRYLSGKQQ